MVWNKICYKCNMIRISVIFFFFYGISFLVRKNSRFSHLWLISERGDDARDNAYHLFIYIREHYPEQNVRYVITEDSPDAEKVTSAGKTVRYGSPEHYLSMILAEALISTHLSGYTTHDYLFGKLERLGLLKGKKVFLQHGLTKDDIASHHYERNRPDLYICALEPEAEFARTCFHQPANVVRLTGFCRYDKLPLPLPGDRAVLPDDGANFRRTILLMPTWRHDVFFYSEKEFETCGYYRNWQGLLASKPFLELLESYDVKAVFYPHHQMQKFLGSFSSPSERVVIASRYQYDVQELLINSDVLITDFSSVFFDYAYMQKPMVFFQFDKEDYRAKNYKQGWFHYEEHGFGKITETIEDTVEELSAVLQHGCQMEPVYWERQNRLFKYHDHENCRRNYQSIKEIVN